MLKICVCLYVLKPVLRALSARFNVTIRPANLYQQYIRFLNKSISEVSTLLSLLILSAEKDLYPTGDRTQYCCMRAVTLTLHYSGG